MLAFATSTKMRQTSIVLTGLIIFLLPVLLGISGVLLPAAGYFPALGFTQFSLHPALSFITAPGVGAAIWLALKTGLIASVLSLLCCFIILTGLMHDRIFSLVRRTLAALVAVPHSAIAIGLVFLLAPSGWLMRILSPAITGFNSPPDWSLVPDPYGWALIFGLMAKEIPFLLMVSLAAIATLPVRQFEQIANSLGYGRVATWTMLILPLIYRQIRLPVFAVLVFSLSVVDMALLLAPTLPPPLAILVLHGFLDADLAARLPASFGAILQIALAGIGIGVWYVGEALCRHFIRDWRRGGWRLGSIDRYLPVFSIMAVIPLAAACAGLVAAFLWSVAGSWFFPSALPQTFHLIHWQDVASYMPLLKTSLLLAGGASFAALFVVLACSYAAPDSTLNNRWLLGCIFMPFFIPQISFLLGMQISLSRVGLDGTWLALIWVHMIFILPYTWLIVIPARRALDRRLDHVAATLGASGWKRFITLHVPLMAYPLGTAIFIGIAVSMALYLPTVFVGAGRINTITVEAVSLASGGSRGPAGLAAMLQIAIPVVSFAIIHWGLRYRFGRFSGMQSGRLQ
jgi:putative thiamine transport system permease protein